MNWEKMMVGFGGFEGFLEGLGSGLGGGFWRGNWVGLVGWRGGEVVSQIIEDRSEGEGGVGVGEGDRDGGLVGRKI